MINLALFVFLLVILTYPALSLVHLFVDSRNLPFIDHYNHWLPGNYFPSNCYPMGENSFFYNCEMNYPNNEYIYLRVDQLTGKIVQATFSGQLGTISQFLYVFGEPYTIHITTNKFGTMKWKGLEIFFYGEYHPETLIYSASFY